MTDLKGKTALVTGSTSGIGRATALALAAEPEELAAVIAYLAGDDASFIHGVTLAVAGGRTAT